MIFSRVFANSVNYSAREHRYGNYIQEASGCSSCSSSSMNLSMEGDRVGVELALAIIFFVISE